METKGDRINRYHNGKIYSLRSHQTDKYYIGSTCDALHKRFYKHKLDYKRWKDGKQHYVSSYEILKYDDCYIELFENCRCNSKIELHAKEGELIRKYKNDVVNKCIAGRTHKEYLKECKDKIREQRKQKYIENKDKRAEYLLKSAEHRKEKHKEYYDRNKELIKEKTRQKHLMDAEHRKAIQKKSYEKNKEKIMERQRIRRAKEREEKNKQQ
jgi:hypothetical protein